MNKQMEQIDQLTREAVKEVFETMLSMEVNPEAPTPLTPDPAGQIIGSVGFIGDATGIIYLYVGNRFCPGHRQPHAGDHRGGSGQRGDGD